MLTIYRVNQGTAEPSQLAVDAAAATLGAGGLALVPTETVYGLAVSVDAAEGPCDADALVNGVKTPAAGSGYRRLFTLKQRELSQTVAWLVAGEADLDRYGVDVDPRAHTLARAFWPGALTIVVQAAPNVPRYMQEADGTIALRASASPVIAALIRKTGSPLACTSSNTHGKPAPAAFADVEPRVLAGVDVAVDAGVTPCRDASTIVSFTNGTLNILRQGALPYRDIARALGL